MDTPIWKRPSFWGDVFKGATLAIATVSFFTSIKIDIAALKHDQVSMQSDIDSTARQVEKLYDRFIDRSTAEQRF